MKVHLKNPAVRDLPRAGERVRLADGRIARVSRITVRWESSLVDELGANTVYRLLAADLTVVPDGNAS